MLGVAMHVARLFELAPPKEFHRVPERDREEVLSMVIARCIERVGQYRPIEGYVFTDWVVTVARNAILSWLREHWRLGAKEQSIHGNESVMIKYDQADDGQPSPQSQLERGQRAAGFWEAARKLDSRCRIVLTARWRGRTNKEIAVLMGTDNQTVGRWVHACLEKIKEIVHGPRRKLANWDDVDQK